MNDEKKHQEMKGLLYTFLDHRKETDFFDMKLKWHDKMEDLIKDTICFSNTVHDRDSYIFFGISDEFEIIGLNDTKRTKQADIVDTMSKLNFSGSERPSFELHEIIIDDREIDVLVIFNNDKTPIFLDKPYGKMKAGCIYTRERDRNTPDNGNATFTQIEALWKKRFHLIKPKKEYFFEILNNRNDWNEIYPEYFNVFQPEYRLKIIQEDGDDDRDEFYSYAMINKRTSYFQIEVLYNSSKLDSFQGVSLDSGRLFIPTARWGYIYDKKLSKETICCYKYYIKNSEEYKLLKFFYDPTNDEQRNAFSRILEIFLIYENEEEKENFENFVKNEIEYLHKILQTKTQYCNVIFSKEKENHFRLEKYRKELEYALSLNQLLKEWRKK